MDPAIKTYPLPNMCCRNCGGRIAMHREHYDTLLPIIKDGHELFTMLGLKRYCCREQLARPQIIVENKVDPVKILGNTQQIKNKKINLTPITPNILTSNTITVTTNIKTKLVPIQYQVGDNFKLTDDLTVHRVTQSTYLAL